MAIVNGDNSLFFASGLDNSGLLKGTVQAEGMISSMAGNIAKINPFAALGVGAIAAFGIVASESHKMVKEFDKAMKEVKTISQAAQNDYEGISNLVFDLSKISPDQPKELAEAYYQVVSAGYDGAEGLNVLATASQAAVAGVTDTKTAVDGLTTILNAYKLSASETENVSDALFNTVKLGKTTMEELSASISQVAPIAAASNIPLNEILSNIATLTKQGVPTAQAMTQIRSAIVGLSKAGALDGAKTLQENMQALYKEMNGNQTAIQAQVGSVEALQAILAVSGKNAESATKDLESYNTIAGATATATKTMLEENGDQWQIFENRIKAKTKGIGDSVLAMSTGIAKDLNSLIGDTDNYTQSIDNEANSIRKLIDEYRDANPETDDRLEILKQLKSINPSIVDGINDEADAYKILTENLSEYNEALIQRRFIAGQKSEAKELNDSLLSFQDEQKEANESFKKSIQEFATSKRVQEYEPLKQLVEEVQNLNISEFEKVKRIQDYLDTDYQGPGYTFFSDNAGFDYDDRLFNLYNSQSLAVEILTDKLQGLNNEIKESEIDFYNLDNEFQNVINKIDKVNNLDELGSFKNDGFRQEIQDAVKARELIIAEFEKISNINLEDYNKNNDVLKPFLESDNEEIRNYAKNWFSVFKDEINETSKLTEEQRKKDLDSFKNVLKEKKRLYENRDKLIGLGREDEASEINLEYDDFNKYIENLLDTNVSNEKRNILLDYIKVPTKEEVKTEVEKTQELINQAFTRDFFIDLGVDTKGVFKDLESEGTTAVDVLKKKYEELKNVTINDDNAEQVKKQFELLERAAKDLDLNVDFTPKVEFADDSINAIKQRIKELTDKYNSASESDRPAIKLEIEIEEDKLKRITSEVDEFAEKINSIRIGDKGLFNVSAISKLIAERKKLQNTLDAGGLSEKQQAKTTANLKEAGTDLNQAIVGGLEEAAGVLNEASALFSKFGNEEMAELTNQLSGVAYGVGRIASGDVIGGSLAVLNSALTVEAESDTEKFEQAVKDLERASVQITNAITNSVGTDLAKAKLESIQNIKDKEEQLKLAQEAEKEARKAVKFLGIKIGDKGTGSGKSPEKLEELEDAARDAEQQFIEATEAYNEFISNVSKNTLSDSIFDGLKEGKTAIQSFADAFEDIVGNSIQKAFQSQYLDPLSKKFADEIGELSDNEGGDKDGIYDLTVAEIKRVKDKYGGQFEALQEIYDQLISDANEAGVDINGEETEQAGLSGAIRSQLTEETGSELTGLFRGGYDLAKQHFALATQELGVSQNILQESIASSAYLNQIQINTANTVAELRLAVTELRAINSNTQGSSTTTRDTGYGL